MTSTEVIQSIVNHRINSGWLIFPYNKTRAWFLLFARLLYVGLFGGFSFLLFGYGDYRTDETVFIPLIVLTIACFFAVLSTFKHLFTIMNAKKNMIVFTQKTVIKSLRGKIFEYPYDSIKNLQLVHIPGNNTVAQRLPEYYIEFLDTRTNRRVEFTRNREFRRADNIFSILQSKIR